MTQFKHSLKRLAVTATLGAAAMTLSNAATAVSFDQNVTPDVIFGGGNANGGFTTDRAAGVELGLRAKVRYDVSDDLPKNIFNSNGDGTYNHATGAPASNPNRARWNFEWSINTDYLGTSGRKLDDLTYLLEMDFDPSLGTSFVFFDPINLPFADHSIGDNSTGNGAGQEAVDPGTYATLIADNNVAQQSWNLDFFDNPPFFDPNADGTYTFVLTAFLGSEEIAATSIDVIVGAGGTAVPEAATLGLFGLGLAGLGLAGLRRRGR